MGKTTVIAVIAAILLLSGCTQYIQQQNLSNATNASNISSNCDLNKDGKVDETERKICGTQNGKLGTGKCGDGTCDDVEKKNNVCPEDCKSAQNASANGTLLSDLPQQSEDAEFMYSAWIGRGTYSNEELDRAFDVAYNLGVKYLKVEFKWGYVEPQNDEWEWDNEEKLDVEHVIELAKKYNMSIIPYYSSFMPWSEIVKLSAENGGCTGIPSAFGQYQDLDSGEYAEYVFSVVQKLSENGVSVKYIELDNEISEMSDGYESESCFHNYTAKEIKEAENAAYDLVKETYPSIMVSSTTFAFPGMSCNMKADCEEDNERRDSYIKAYFGDEPKPKFDFLAIHETLGGTGNPYTSREKPANATYEYNIGSYNDAYDMWREILADYGYDDVPIFTTESGAVIKGYQDAEIIQKVVFARANGVVGWSLSQLTGSEKFTEGRGSDDLAYVGITKLWDGYELREGYYGFYAMMEVLANYPNYEGNVMGELNAQEPWVEKFSDDDGDMLYVAFLPYHPLSFRKTETITLNIGAGKEAKITKTDTGSTSVNADSNGDISVSVGVKPVFIEVE